MSRKKKSKANKAPASAQLRQLPDECSRLSETEHHQGHQSGAPPQSAPQIAPKLKQEPQVIDLDASLISKPEPTLPSLHNLQHPTRLDQPNTAAQSAEHRSHGAEAAQSPHKQKASAKKKPKKSAARKQKRKSGQATPASNSSKKRRRPNQIHPANGQPNEPPAKLQRISDQPCGDPPSAPLRNPGEKTMLCETVVQKDGDTHVIVTTKEQYPTAVRCPCDIGCGSLVRVGNYAKYCQVGTPFCPHCRSVIGSEHGFNSYPQLVAHVKTKTCKSVQQAQPPNFNPRRVLGDEVYNKINNPVNSIFKNGIAYFKCFHCAMEVDRTIRFHHCLKCFGH